MLFRLTIDFGFSLSWIIGVNIETLFIFWNSTFEKQIIVLTVGWRAILCETKLLSYTNVCSTQAS